MLSLQSEVHSGGPKTKKIYFHFSEGTEIIIALHMV